MRGEEVDISGIFGQGWALLARGKMKMKTGRVPVCAGNRGRREWMENDARMLLVGERKLPREDGCSAGATGCHVSSNCSGATDMWQSI
jgi:hypothetical protein